ncbi:hypothetical protein D9M68_759510 [compost metagenome]
MTEVDIAIPYEKKNEGDENGAAMKRRTCDNAADQAARITRPGKWCASHSVTDPIARAEGSCRRHANDGLA